MTSTNGSIPLFASMTKHTSIDRGMSGWVEATSASARDAMDAAEMAEVERNESTRAALSLFRPNATSMTARFRVTTRSRATARSRASRSFARRSSSSRASGHAAWSSRSGGGW